MCSVGLEWGEIITAELGSGELVVSHGGVEIGAVLAGRCRIDRMLAKGMVCVLR